MDPKFFEKVVIGRSWANTNPPEERKDRLHNTVLTRREVSNHEKMLAVALVASGAISQADLDTSDWLQLKEDSPISAASFHGVAYCTLHGLVRTSEIGTDVGGVGRAGKAVAWHAELRAASARLSAAKALVQLSGTESAPKAFYADV